MVAAGAEADAAGGAPQASVRDKKAVTALRKAYSAWDRARRDADSAVAKSQLHEATRGCLFEEELRSTIIRGSALKDQVEALEQNFLLNMKLTDKEIEDGLEATQQIEKLIKIVQKRHGALKTWWRMPAESG